MVLVVVWRIVVMFVSMLGEEQKRGRLKGREAKDPDILIMHYEPAHGQHGYS
jgi:hypothetical protein